MIQNDFYCQLILLWLLQFCLGQNPHILKTHNYYQYWVVIDWLFHGNDRNLANCNTHIVPANYCFGGRPCSFRHHFGCQFADWHTDATFWSDSIYHDGYSQNFLEANGPCCHSFLHSTIHYIDGGDLLGRFCFVHS